jgi:hypothetical protein
LIDPRDKFGKKETKIFLSAFGTIENIKKIMRVKGWMDSF